MAPVSVALPAGGRSVSAQGGSGGAHLKAPPPVLPYGPTLHYTGCGCPYTWAAGCRLCDWGDSCVQQAHSSMQAQPGQAHLAPIRKLKVGFCIPHANVTGGLKMLLEQIRLLRQRGHRVVAMTRSELADAAVPAWSDVEVDEDVVCRLDQRFRDCYDVDSCDAIVTGIFHQVPEWLTSTSAPVLYYEQGHEWLFGDPVRFREAGNYAAQDHLFHMTMHLPVALAAVSEAVQSIICHEFGRSCLLVHNGVDCGRFRPGTRDAALLGSPTRVLGPPPAQASPPDGAHLASVLLVGNPGLGLKGFDCAIATLALVQRTRPIEVYWVCQQEPPEHLLALIGTSSLRVNLYVNPPQNKIPAFYRGHDCFLFTSKYEAWGMPVLEAMASGLPVVSTETAGVTSFATPSVDCLMAPPGEPAELAQHVLGVLEDAGLATRLAAAARQTALAYTPTRVVSQLERVLYSLTACRQELMALRLQALPDSQMAAAAAVKACAGAAAAHKAALKARQQRAAAAAAVSRDSLGLPHVASAGDLEGVQAQQVKQAQHAQHAQASLQGGACERCNGSTCERCVLLLAGGAADALGDGGRGATSAQLSSSEEEGEEEEGEQQQQQRRGPQPKQGQKPPSCTTSPTAAQHAAKLQLRRQRWALQMQARAEQHRLQQQQAAYEQQWRQSDEQQQAAYEQQRRQSDEQQQAAYEQQWRLSDEQQQAAYEQQWRLSDEQQQAAYEQQRRVSDEQQQAAYEQQRRVSDEQQQAAYEQQRRVSDEQQQAAYEERRRLSDEQQQAYEEQRRVSDEQQQAAYEEQRRLSDEQQQAAYEEQRRLSDEQQQAAYEQQRRVSDEQQQAAYEEQRRLSDEQQQAYEEQRRLSDEQQQAAYEEQRRQSDDEQQLQQQQAYEDQQKALQQAYVEQQQKLQQAYAGVAVHTSP